MDVIKSDDVDARPREYQDDSGEDRTASGTGRITDRPVTPRQQRHGEIVSRLEEQGGAAQDSAVATVGGTFDPDPLLDMVDGDVEFVTHLIGTLERTIQDSMARLREAAATGDATGIRVAAHTLKGSVGHFGAREVVTRSLRLEVLGRDGDIDTAAAEIGSLGDCVTALLAELATFVEGCRDAGVAVRGEE